MQNLLVINGNNSKNEIMLIYYIFTEKSRTL